MRRTPLVSAAALFIALGVTAPAAAQGNSGAHGHGHQGGITAGSAGSPTPLPGSGDGARSFGVWLDDASISAVGGGWATLSFGYFRADLFHEVDLPTADVGLAVAPRTQVGFSVPVYNVAPPGGTPVHGVGDVYLHAKIQLRDPSTSADGVGYAVMPIAEVVRSPLPGQSKVNWAAPVSVELRRDGWRAYGSGGYFSRGSAFGAIALERSITANITLSGTFSDSFIVRMDPAVPASLGRSRADVSGGASYQAGASWIVFGSIGRTVSAHDAESTNVSLVAGVSLNLAAPPQTRAKSRKSRRGPTRSGAL